MNKPNLKSFPLSPGVYLFKDNKSKVIYAGRATYLKKRIANYFSKKIDPKTARMVQEAKKIDFIKTDNLLDAVILEAGLIKKYQPKYNIKEKDDRSFVYIVIPKKAWAYPLIIRGQQLAKFKPAHAEIFGPFQSYSLVKNLLNILRKLFPYSACKLNQGRPCFYNQISLCPGKCIGVINAKEYQQNINNLIAFLKGQKIKALKSIKKTSPEKLRLLKNIDDSIFITKPQTTGISFGRIEGYDISHFAGKETVGSMVVWQNNDFNKTQYRLFKVKTAAPNDDLDAIEEIISRRLRHKEWPYPALILVDGGKNQIKTVEKVLASHKINIPVAGIAKYPHYRHPDPPVGGEVSRRDSSVSANWRIPQNDRLVFGKIQKSLKDLISLSMPQLLQIRNEAHRFANSLRKKLLKKQIKVDLR